ncbi:MAG: SDR family oxidoreductase [Anaerolineales bacterium]|jgi:NAD(P)-dependent dehydrogenase (short-subunit alcohol dehydrogenase family)|nr:SDR family oxidoreductase [Anaerolineales bacterium]
MKLQDKWVLVTGAAVRVGRALALGAAQEGANVVVHYGGSSAAAQSVKAEIEQMGRRARLIQADLSQPDQIAQLMQQAFEPEPLYALVNSAAIFAPLDWRNVDRQAWERHLQINLSAPFFLSQQFGERLPETAEGRIVNILDWRALRPGPDHLPYTISKAALAALTQSLAQALAPRITVNGLALGAILPPSGGGDLKAPIRGVPAGRWAELSEVQQALIFLLSGPAYITGEIVHVDGGRHLTS